jgi:hypothetical protein
MSIEKSWPLKWWLEFGCHFLTILFLALTTTFRLSDYDRGVDRSTKTSWPLRWCTKLCCHFLIVHIYIFQLLLDIGNWITIEVWIGQPKNQSRWNGDQNLVAIFCGFFLTLMNGFRSPNCDWGVDRSIEKSWLLRWQDHIQIVGFNSLNLFFLQS